MPRQVARSDTNRLTTGADPLETVFHNINIHMRNVGLEIRTVVLASNKRIHGIANMV
jgi:hypothetical protein